MRRAVLGILIVAAVALAVLAGWAALAEPIDVAPPATDLSDMVFVSEGSFVVRGRRQRLPAFWIDRFEVTEADWDRRVEATGLEAPPYGEADPRGDEFPVRYVSRRDALRYAAWDFRRLPSNLEWERACQGPQGQPLPWGSGYLAVANTLEAWSGRSLEGRGVTRVGTFESGRSGVGAYDMIGNVREWTGSDFRDLLHFKPTGEERGQWTAGRSAGEVFCVVRGASFATRVSRRGAALEEVELAGTRSDDLGFRCAISVSELQVQGEVLPAIRELGYRDPWNGRFRVEAARQRLLAIGAAARPYLRRARDAAGIPLWLRDRIVAILHSTDVPTP